MAYTRARADWVDYTAVHRNPDGVPQSWAAPSLHIGAGPQSSIAAATPPTFQDTPSWGETPDK